MLKADDEHLHTFPSPRHDLGVGAGASIVVAVATSLAIVFTLLVLSLAPAKATALAGHQMTGAVLQSEGLHEPGQQLASVSYRLDAPVVRDDTIAVQPGRDGENHSLAAIIVFAMLFGWALTTADLWRAVINRVKSTHHPRS